jgi:tetratricopeptide (TPR) repeat protein
VIQMAIMLCLAMGAWQRSAMDSFSERIGELHEVIRSSSSSSEDRNIAFQECLALRSRVLSSDELDGAALAFMMCQQAEDLIATGLALDQLGMTVLFGYPTESESSHALGRINAGLIMVAKAELAVERAIFDLERIPASKRTAVQRESLLQLREQERDRRLPLLRGSGLVHRAEGFEQGAVRQATMRDAAIDLEALRERLDGAALARATWLYGLAIVRLDRYEDAEAAFRHAATGSTSTTDDVLAARLGGIVNRSHQGGADRGVRSAAMLEDRYQETSQLRHRLLIVDHQARLYSQSGRFGEAATAWSRLHAPLLDAGLDGAMARALLDERIRRLPVSDPKSMKSADLLLAHASRPELDATRLAGALRVVLESDSLGDRQRARAMSSLGLALIRSGHSLEAAAVLLDLANTIPDEPEAAAGIDLAARLSLQRALADPANVVAHTLAVASLDRMLSRFIDRPDIDGWRLAAGRLAASDGRLHDALAAYEAVQKGSEQEQESLREGAAVLLRESRIEGEHREDVFDGMRSRRARGNAATLVVLDLLLVEAMLDAGQSTEAAGVIRSLATTALTESQQSTLETLRLRAAEGDAASLAKAARGVAERGGADGGLAIAASLQQVLLEIGAQEMRTGNPVELDRMQQEVEPLAEALADWLGSHRSDDAASWLLVIEGLRRSGRPAEALAAANRMLKLHPDIGELLFERAESMVMLGGEERLTEAMLIYRRLSRVARESAPRRWWWCQLRMLEILSDLDRNTDRIAPRIRRLMDDDESLGGADVQRGFQVLLIRFQ